MGAPSRGIEASDVRDQLIHLGVVQEGGERRHRALTAFDDALQLLIAAARLKRGIAKIARRRLALS
jgi:hypothetical protein